VTSGPRSTIWWGVAGLLAIEGTMFALLFACYFYYARNFAAWPPSGTPRPDILLGTINMALMLISVWPMRLAQRAGWREDRPALPLPLAICTIAGLLCLALRFLEFDAVHTKWDTHAYGSIVWSILGMHLVHLLTSTFELGLLTVLMHTGEVERKHFVDVDVNALYWYFVVFAWVPLYATIYFAPRLL
jgi:cytochrome c oxidase subunit I+III